MGKMKRFFVAGAAVTSVLASLTACSSSSGSSGAGGTTVRVGVFGGDASAPWVVAQEKGYFAKQGISVKITDFSSSPALAAALISGSIDVGYLGTGTAYKTLGQGANLTVLNDWHQTNYSVYVVNSAKATSSVSAGYPNNVKSLAGLKVGVPALGTQLQSLTTAMLDGAGVDSSKTTFIATGALPTLIAALKNGKVDAQTLTWPSYFLVKGAGVNITPVVDVAQPGNAGPGFSDGMFAYDVANTSFAKNTTMLNKYCTAMRQSVTWMKDPANLGAASQIVAKLDGIPAADVESVWGKVTPSYGVGLTSSEWTDQPAWVTGGGTVKPYSSAVTQCGM